MSKLRPIRFRGFNKKRGIWLYGNYILNRGAHFIAPQEFADGKTWEDYEVEEESIGQFVFSTYVTKAKKVVDIYEGDILRGCQPYEDGKHDGFVKYDQPTQRFKLVTQRGNSYHLEDLVVFTVDEVIGNTYNQVLEDKGWTKMQDGKPA